MKHMEPQRSHDELNIMNVYVDHVASTEECDLGLSYCIKQCNMLWYITYKFSTQGINMITWEVWHQEDDDIYLGKLCKFLLMQILFNKFCLQYQTQSR